MSNARDKANIPSLNFSSTGIDDNATSTAITIDSSENILLNTTSAKGDDAGTFAPVLTVNGGSYDGLIEVAGNRSDGADAGVARLQFIQNSNSATYKEVAEIRVETEGATANQRGGRINFRTRANGSTSTTEAMRIDSSGNVGIGTSSPSAGLDVVSTNYPYIAEFRQANAGNPGAIVIDSPADNGGRPSYLNFETGSVLKWGIGLGYVDTNRSFHISTSSLADGTTGSKFTITPSGNVGIGTTSPGTKLDIVSDSSARGIHLRGRSSDNIGLIDFMSNDSATRYASIGAPAANSFAIETNNSERMRIDSSGHFGFGTTTSSNFVNFQGGTSNSTGINFDNPSSPNPYGYRIAFSSASPDNNSQYFHRMQDSTSVRCLIHSDGDIQNHDNSYGGISDLKLKEQITNASSQWEDIKNLQVKKFKFKTDVANGDSDAHWRLGLIAQEVETTSPNLVKNNPDLDDNNNDLGTVTKTVKYSILYMKAVKALQEAIERIETLEAKVQTLENNQP